MKYLRLILLSLVLVLSHAGITAQIYWGYSDNNVANGLGLGQNTVVSGAIYIPEEIAELYKGKSATSIRVGLNNSVNEITVFITEDLNSTPVTQQKFGAQKAGIASFNLDNAYTIDGKGFYVGYSCVGINPIGRSNIYDINGCWVKEGDGEWIDCASDEDYKYNALNIAVRIEGDDMPVDARLIVNNETSVSPNEDLKLTVKLENLSTKAIKKYQVEYDIDNGEKQTIEKTTYLTSGSTTSINIDVPGFSEIGMHSVNLHLVSIDGNEDAYAGNNRVVANIKVTDKSFVRRMVVEEGTGTWCGWCPRGIVAFEYMEEKYPDTFIGIAAHATDVFTESTYAPLHSYFSGYPKCIVNRDPAKVYDPTSSNLESAYKSMGNEPAVANVYVSAYIEDNNIMAKATTTFAAPDKGLDYRIAFVILEDSIVGYEQTNNYSGGGNGAMGGFENLPQYAPIKFNHVARGIYDYNGIEKSVPTDVKEGELYEFEKKISMPEVQRTKYLSIVALLINGKTGLIDNAAKAHIAQSQGIEEDRTNNSELAMYTTPDGTIICSENGELEVFNIQGVRVPNYGLNHGIYIVRHTSESGVVTTRKIIF